MSAMTVGPLPEGLKRLPERFSCADRHRVAPDLKDGVRRLVQSAWDGSMHDGVVPASMGNNASGRKIPLKDAIRISVVELDASATAFRELVLLNSHINDVFDAPLLCQDVVKGFHNLKQLSFDEFNTIDFDNIQVALSNNEDSWKHGSHNVEVFIVQHFCLRMVQFAESLRQRTGCDLEDAPSLSSSSRKRLAEDFARAQPEPYNYETTERIVGGPQWPQCANIKPNWVQLFGPRSTVNAGDDDDDDDGPWLTPRMAAKIHHTAIVKGESLLKCLVFPPRLPKVARPFFKKSQAWRLAFRDCYVRIGLRLQKGLLPEPNCTGEEMAFHNIMCHVLDAEDCLLGDEKYNALPEYPNDEEYEMVRERIVQDGDVLMLFDDNDNGFDSDGDNSEEINVDNPILRPGSLTNFVLGTGEGMMRMCNLHPNDWFLAFRKDRFRDHLQAKRFKRRSRRTKRNPNGLASL